MGEDIEESGDFIVNEKKVVNLTRDGVKKVENFFHIENLARSGESQEIQHNIILALRAHNPDVPRSGLRGDSGGRGYDRG